MLTTGIAVHALFTGRLTLVLTWLVAFVLQGELRSWYLGTSWIVPLTPMTSAVFMVFTLYMIPDPATTPIKPLHQVLFAMAIAAAYGMLLIEHVVYCLFLALAIVCAIRGAGLYTWTAWQFLRANPRQCFGGASLTGTPQLRRGKVDAETAGRDGSE
jgi:hypothetical protein